MEIQKKVRKGDLKDKKNIRNEDHTRGITLVALVVTIVVLLILAGVTITTLFSDNGIITKAQEAANATNEAQKNTIAQLEELEEEVSIALGEYTLKDIKKSINYYYVEQKNNGKLETNLEINGAFYEVQNRINNSKYKDKLVNLEGTLVYIGDNEEEKEELASQGVNTTLTSIIRNIGASNKNAMYYEEGFIRINPKNMWEDGYGTASITEAELEQLLTNSTDETEQSKISYLNSDGTTTFKSVCSGVRVYYDNEYIGTLVANCDVNRDGMINGNDLTWLVDFNNKKVTTINKELAVVKTCDVNNDGIIDDLDKEIMTSDNYFLERY